MDEPIPQGLRLAAWRGDVAAAKAITDWLEERGRLDDARCMRIYAGEIALQVSLAQHIKETLKEAPLPTQHGGRVDVDYITSVLHDAGLPISLFPRTWLRQVAVSHQGRNRLAWNITMPRDWLGEDHEDGALATCDAVLHYLGLCFPRTLFEGTDELASLSFLGAKGRALIDPAVIETEEASSRAA